mmetsp:Transcript_37591/g.106181  ORF Transcript_37591/g.106181 Transcript_37591/m.106181 type:complete len:232 (+) Transcript_37591:744-1439(+)
MGPAPHVLAGSKLHRQSGHPPPPRQGGTQSDLHKVQRLQAQPPLRPLLRLPVQFHRRGPRWHALLRPQAGLQVRGRAPCSHPRHRPPVHPGVCREVPRRKGCPSGGGRCGDRHRPRLGAVLRALQGDGAAHHLPRLHLVPQHLHRKGERCGLHRPHLRHSPRHRPAGRPHSLHHLRQDGGHGLRRRPHRRRLHDLRRGRCQHEADHYLLPQGLHRHGGVQKAAGDLHRQKR